MKRNFRKYLLNILGLVIFSSIALITIIIARGNRIDITTGQIIETGTIRIDSQPEDVTVYLNSKKVDLKEKRIEGIDPGEYVLTIQHDNFTNWESVVEVSAGFITDISVTLFPIGQQLEVVTQAGIDKVVFDRARSKAIYTVTEHAKGSEVGIWRLQLADSFFPLTGSNAALKITNFTDRISFLRDNDYHLLASPNGDKLLIAAADFSKVYIINTNAYNEPDEKALVALDYPIDKIEFLDNNNLIINSHNLLIEYNIDSKNSALLYYHPTTPAVYDIESNAVYWLDVDKDKVFSRQSNTTTPIKLENIELPKGTNKLEVANSGKILILGGIDQLHFVETTTSYIKTFTGISLASVSPNAEFIIANNKDGQLTFLYTTISQVYKEISHRTTNSELKLTDINNANNIQWSFDSSFFIFQNDKKDIVALDSLGKNKFTLVENQNNRISGDSYTLDGSNNALFIVLQDGVEPNSKFNMYTLEFEPGNN